MVAVTKDRLWLTLLSCLVTAVIFCAGLYFLAIRGGASFALAALWVGTTFGVSVIALGCGLRVLRDPQSQPWSNPRLSTRVYFWIATGVVVPVLACILNLGASFIAAIVLMMIQAAGLPVTRLAEPLSWIAAAISLACASGAWWVIWKQYKASLNKDER